MLGKNKFILLIEDNADDELLTVRALKKLNYTSISVARSGAEALNYLLPDNNTQDLFRETEIQKQRPLKTPDLVLLDLNLPVIDGLTILKRIRSDKKTKNIPVIILTSSAEERDIEESYEYGANSYIRKPVDFLEFEKVASLIGEYWLILNRSTVQHRY